MEQSHSVSIFIIYFLSKNIEPFAARGLAVVNRKFDSWQVVLELS